MKLNPFVAFGLLALALLFGGCVTAPYYDAYPQQQYPYQAPAPQAQYVPPQQVAPVGCIPPYVPVWNGCAMPAYRPQYYGFAPMYDYPIFFPQAWVNFNFGGHHRGGRHHR